MHADWNLRRLVPIQRVSRISPLTSPAPLPAARFAPAAARHHRTRSRNSLEYWIHDLEMARVRNQYYRHLFPVGGHSRADSTEMVFDVTGLTDRVRRGVLAFELLEDR